MLEKNMREDQNNDNVRKKKRTMKLSLRIGYEINPEL
jgi:hypothetical protein